MMRKLAKLLNWLCKRASGRHSRLTLRLAFEQLESRLAPAVNVLSYHNDAGLTGQNLSETALTPGNVNPATFGKLFSTLLDGQVYAQPLYMQGLNIGGNSHDTVFVATEHDSLYAIDAES